MIRSFHHIQPRRLTGCVTATALLTLAASASAQHFEYDKLLAPDGGAFDDFGYAVSVLGDLAIAGAYGDDGIGGFDSGSAYVYRRNGPDWIFEKKLEASDAASTDYFGYAVELHNDMAMVGAISDEPGGSVYVFRRTPLNGDWQQVQKIVAPDTALGDSFGCAIDADGRYMAIGARMDADVLSDAGSVYIYEYEESIQQWVYLDEFRAHDPAANEWFGEELAMSGDYVVVGVPRDDPNGPGSGSAYVFKRNIGTWVEQAKIIPTDGAAEARFGYDVAIDIDTIAIGATEDWATSKRSGSVYVHRGSNMSWPLEQKLYDSTGIANHWDRFGSGVDVVGDTLLIGSEGSDANEADFGAAYVYTRSGSTWSPHLRHYFGFDGEPVDEFGGAVDLDLDGRTAIVGAYMKSDQGQNTGAAYMFNDVHFLVAVSPDPPVAGLNATFTVTGGEPFTRTYLGYSIRGLQQTYIAPLNITIELRAAVQTGGVRTTDVNGDASWTLLIPSGAAGRNLWIQAIQFEKKTNVITTQIQP